MSTAEKSSTDLDAVTDHLTLAVLANRSHGLDSTFEAVESVTNPGCDQFETFVVFIATHFTNSHTGLLLILFESASQMEIAMQPQASGWGG